MRPVAFALLLCHVGSVSNRVQPLRSQEIATAPYSGTVSEERVGSLAYEHGCLLFYGDTRNLILAPVWPDGTVFNGTSVIFHKPGKADEPIVLNQEFVLKGQRLTWTSVPGTRGPLFQRQCAATPFAVADVAPAN